MSGDSTTTNRVLIHHSGHLTCLATYRVQEETRKEIEDFYKLNPNSPPSMAWFAMVSKQVREGNDEIKEMVITQVKDWVHPNIKSSVNNNNTPNSSVLEASKKVKSDFVKSDSLSDYQNMVMVSMSMLLIRKVGTVFITGNLLLILVKIFSSVKMHLIGVFLLDC